MDGCGECNILVAVVCIGMDMTRHANWACKRSDTNVEKADPDTDPASLRTNGKVNIR